MLGLFERKGERVKGLVGAQPDKAALANIDIGLKGGGITVADAAVEAIAGNH